MPLWRKTHWGKKARFAEASSVISCAWGKRKKMTNSTGVSDIKMTRFGYRVDLIRGRHVRVKVEAKIARHCMGWYHCLKISLLDQIIWVVVVVGAIVVVAVVTFIHNSLWWHFWYYVITTLSRQEGMPSRGTNYTCVQDKTLGNPRACLNL